MFPNANQPLYSGAKITLAASMILLISYAMRHALSGEALADLLVLIEIHCLSPNLCETNLKTFKKFFQNLKSPLQFHFYCEKCSTYHGLVKRDMCPNCHHPTRKNSSSYFLVIPIITQLSSLFAGTDILWQMICNSNIFNNQLLKFTHIHMSNLILFLIVNVHHCYFCNLAEEFS